MRFLLLKCQWCGEEGRFLVEGSVPDTTGWIERQGIAPKMIRNMESNTKATEPVKSKLDFCKDACNQKAKDAEVVALAAADKAWLEAYQNQKATS